MKSWGMLIEECPLLYKNGIIFECGIGWYDIIRDLSIKIERILEDYEEANPQPEDEDCDMIEIFAIQVKEKYGTLRFYLSFETDEIADLILEAEALSSQTCEVCGDDGKMRGEKWYFVRCDKCYMEKK